MTKDAAIKSAQFAANKYREPYAIVQVYNGQWLCEQLAYIQGPNNSYTARELRTMETFLPTGSGAPVPVQRIPQVHEALSRFYKRPVVGGYTDGGWPVIRPADNEDAVVDGGLGGTVPPQVLAVLQAQTRLLRELDALLEGRD